MITVILNDILSLQLFKPYHYINYLFYGLNLPYDDHSDSKCYSPSAPPLTLHCKDKCRKFETNIPRKGISGPQSQFPHSFVCERIIYSHDGSAFSAGGNMWTDLGNI